MSYRTQAQTQALDAIAERVTRDKPTHKNVAFVQMQGLVVSLRNSVEAIGKLHANPNPIETREAHIKRVAVAARQLSNKVKEMQERINHITQTGMKDVQERISKKVNLVPDGYAAEIRQAFRGMKHTQQIKLLNQLAEENQGAELAAIVKAPAILTGINPELQNQYSDFIVSKHATEEWEEQNALIEAMKTAFVASDVGKNTVAEYSDPAKLADIESREVASQQANANFSNSMI